MKKDYTHIITIIDKSGSMQSVKEDSIGGYNEFLHAQKQVPGKATITTAIFNQGVEFTNVFDDINDAKGLTGETYQPAGYTALYDAIGLAIDKVGTKLAELSEDERPEKVMVCILTDGQENCSHEFTHDDIRKKIELQTNTYKWEFIYLGANQDAFATGSAMGIRMSMNYVGNSAGTLGAYQKMSQQTIQYRTNQ